MNNPIYTLDDIPDPEKYPEFWSTVQSPHFKHSVHFLLINEIRKYDPETMSPASCRSQLAKLKAWQELLDWPAALIKKDEKTDLITDEINQNL